MYVQINTLVVYCGLWVVTVSMKVSKSEKIKYILGQNTRNKFVDLHVNPRIFYEKLKNSKNRKNLRVLFFN